MKLTIFLCLTSVMLSSNIPNDTLIPLFRDQNRVLRLVGEINPPLHGEQIYHPRLKSRSCGVWNHEGRYTLRPLDSPFAANVELDISDMIGETFWSVEDHSIKGLCISFYCQLGRTVSSLIYRSLPSGESLLLAPEHAEQYALNQTIAYVYIHLRRHVYTSTSVGGREEGPVLPMEIGLNEQEISGITDEQFADIRQMIEDNGGSVHVETLGRFVQVRNCNDGLASVLPDLTYRLRNSPGDEVWSSEIVFTPNDYLVRSETTDICTLLVGPARGHLPLILTDTLIRKIGGIHFDYSNNRIGFFDPF